MSGEREQRRDPRLPRVESIRVHVNPSLLDVNLMEKTVSATTVDVSRRGLHIQIGREVSEGDALEIWITIRGKPGDFLLRGCAHWVREDSASGFHHVGVELEPAPGTAYGLWKQLFDTGPAGD